MASGYEEKEICPVNLDLVGQLMVGQLMVRSRTMIRLIGHSRCAWISTQHGVSVPGSDVGRRQSGLCLVALHGGN